MAYKVQAAFVNDMLRSLTPKDRTRVIGVFSG